jgi:DNA-binding SARP family transcriptional activator
MFGSFSIRFGEHCVTDQDNRMRKVWLLLAYLICTRNGHSTQESYLDLLWNDNDENEDPTGRLKTLFYRARTMLNKLEGITGRELIIYKSGNYAWNTDIPVWLDVEEFDRLCKAAEATADEDEKLSYYIQALELYQGDFLPKLSMESWIIPISVYYHQMFLDALSHTLPLLESRGQWEEAKNLCMRAIKIEPYTESLYQHLMRCYLASGNRTAALATYEDMSKRLFKLFGAMPSEESRQLYRDASREPCNLTMSLDTLREQMKEPLGNKGAMFCEYDFFKLLYQMQVRSLIRSNETIDIALFSLHGQNEKPLSRRSTARAIDNLKHTILTNLRQGDVVTQCNASQLLIMLPHSTYDTSTTVCQRIIRAFFHQYPHSPVNIRYSIQPLGTSSFSTPLTTED